MKDELPKPSRSSREAQVPHLRSQRLSRLLGRNANRQPEILPEAASYQQVFGVVGGDIGSSRRAVEGHRVVSQMCVSFEDLMPTDEGEVTVLFRPLATRPGQEVAPHAIIAQHADGVDYHLFRTPLLGDVSRYTDHRLTNRTGVFCGEGYQDSLRLRPGTTVFTLSKEGFDADKISADDSWSILRETQPLSADESKFVAVALFLARQSAERRRGDLPRPDFT